MNRDEILKFYEEKNLRINEYIEDEISLFSLGTNCFILNDKETSILIDPYLTRNASDKEEMSLMGFLVPSYEKTMSLYQYAGSPKIDGILLTHNHYDHIFDLETVTSAINSIHNFKSPIYGTETTKNIALGMGVNNKVEKIKYGETISIGKFKITFLHGKHSIIYPFYKWTFLHWKQKSPIKSINRFYKYKEGHMFDLLFEHKNGKRFLMIGSFNFGKYHVDDVDTLILAVGGHDKMKESFKKKLYLHYINSCHPKKVLLSHYDDFKIDFDHPVKFIVGDEKIFDLFKSITPDIPISFINMLTNNNI